MFESAPSAPQSFFQVWIKALTKPSEQTFAEIANAPDASPTKAYLWLGISYLVTYIFIMFISLLGGTGQYGDIASAIGGSLIAVICGAPFGAALALLFFAIDIAIIQWVAGLFKGSGTYNQLVYAVAAFSAPISMVSGLMAGLAVIPYVGLCFSLISAGIGIYSLVLMVMAVKGVNRFGWGEAIGSVLLPGIVIGIFCACLVIGVLTLLGPVIGNVFSSMSY
jgi:hypothetical protein